MAHFRGTVQGQSGQASRLGSKKSGLTVQANGWGFGVRVLLYVGDDGTDHACITLTEGSGYNAGRTKVLGDFTADDLSKSAAKVYADPPEPEDICKNCAKLSTCDSREEGAGPLSGCIWWEPKPKLDTEKADAWLFLMRNLSALRYDSSLDDQRPSRYNIVGQEVTTMKHLFKVGTRVRVVASRAYSSELSGKTGVVLGYHTMTMASGWGDVPWALIGFGPKTASEHSLHSGSESNSAPVPDKYRGRCWYVSQSRLRRITPLKSR